MIEAFREFLPLFLGGGMDVAAMAWLDGYAEGKRGHRKRDDEILEARIDKALNQAKLATSRVLEVLEKLQNDVASDVKAIWEGFSRFSRRDLQLEPETVLLAWFPPILPHLHSAQDALNGVQPAPTLVDEYNAALAKIWNRFTGQGEEPPKS
jgi:hypothetical protein